LYQPVLTAREWVGSDVIRISASIHGCCDGRSVHPIPL